MSSSCPLISESLSPTSDAIRHKTVHLKGKGMLKQIKMINIIKSGFKYKSNLSLFLVLITIISQFMPIVRCQDFEDLKNSRNNNNRQSPNNGGNLQQFAPQQLPQAFQPNRQPMQAQAQAQPHSHSFTNGANVNFAASSPPLMTSQPQQQQAPPSTRQASFQRPMLSNRFAQSNPNQQLSAQASTNVGSVVVESGGGGAAGQSSQLVSAASQPAGSLASSNGGGTGSNIEQIMKNALARSAKFEATNIEARQDGPSEPAIQSRSGAQFQSTAAAANAGSTSQASSTAALKERAVEPSESTASTQPIDEAEKQTTVANLANQGAHETVYSDQRFASLFARRGAGKKSKFTPTEQVKAKPTLPSFIKSPPDPKQFTSNPVDGQDRPFSQASGGVPVSARLQQQLQQQQQQSNQNRLNNAANLQKKTSSTVASNNAALVANNNKRSNPPKQMPLTNAGTNTAKASSSSSKANGQPVGGGVTSKPATSNNPFNRSQVNSSDPANVIAMARKRLLANNALQQKQTN